MAALILIKAQKTNNELMVLKRQKSHYPSVKKLSELCRGIESKSNGHFYCLKEF